MNAGFNETIKCRIYEAADKITHEYKMGNLNQTEAHESLNALNDTVFSMYDFGLCGKVDPAEVQEYIHGLQEKYTINFIR